MDFVWVFETHRTTQASMTRRRSYASVCDDVDDDDGDDDDGGGSRRVRDARVSTFEGVRSGDARAR